MEFSLSRSCFREIGKLLSWSLSISSLLCLFLFREGFEHELLELDLSARLDIGERIGMRTAVSKLEQTLLKRHCSCFKITKGACHGFSQLKNHRPRKTRPTAMIPRPTPPAYLSFHVHLSSFTFTCFLLLQPFLVLFASLSSERKSKSSSDNVANLDFDFAMTNYSNY